jgi:hypothetical protein
LKGAKLALTWMRLSDAKNGFWRGDRLCKSVCRTRYSKWSKEFPEQDGLILRVIEESGRASAWPYLSRFAGYCLTGLTSEQAWFMFYGGTASGKSTLINVLRGLLGPYALALPENYFLVTTNTSDFATANLAGVRLATCVETNETVPKDASPQRIRMWPSTSRSSGQKREAVRERIDFQRTDLRGRTGSAQAAAPFLSLWRVEP